MGFRLFSGVGVGWRRQCKIRLSLRDVENRRAVIIYRFTVLALPEMGIGFHHVRRGKHWRGRRVGIDKCTYRKPHVEQFFGIPLLSGSGRIATPMK